MRKITVSDGALHFENIDYIRAALTLPLSDLGARTFFGKDETRCFFAASYDEKYADFVKSEIEDKTADVIAVKYKYDFFKKTVRTGGLNDFETGVLLSSLIAADIEEDKRYISRKLKAFDDYAIDGFYNFRLSPLKRKWAEIASYIPPYFPSGRLKDFVSYLADEKKGKRVTVEGGKVYDKHYNHLRRADLINCGDEGALLREVILSGCGEVRVIGEIPMAERKRLGEYFGGKIIFC